MSFTIPIENGYPTAFFRALDTADADSAEAERLRAENAELHCRVQELETERAALLDRLEVLEWGHKTPRTVQRG